MFSEIDSESEYVPLARKKRSNKRTGKASKVSLRKRKRKVASSDAADEQAIKR